MTVIDFNEAMRRAKSASFEPLPDGVYDMVALESTPLTSSTGKPMIKVKWQVETGPLAGKKLFDQYVFSADNDNALSFFFQHMRFFGLDETFFSQNPAWEQVAAALPGRRCQMQLGQRMYEGRPQNDVVKIMPPATSNPVAPASGIAPMQPPAAVQMGVPGVPTMPQVPQVPQVPQPQVPVQPPPLQQQPPAQYPQPAPPQVPQPQVPQVPQPAPPPVAPPQQPMAPPPVPQPQQPYPQQPQPQYQQGAPVPPQQSPPQAYPQPQPPAPGYPVDGQQQYQQPQPAPQPQVPAPPVPGQPQVPQSSEEPF